ncbi:MAG: hypothetical protein V4495_16125 [Pseudomonadota bacterium]
MQNPASDSTSPSAWGVVTIITGNVMDNTADLIEVADKQLYQAKKFSGCYFKMANVLFQYTGSHIAG